MKKILLCFLSLSLFANFAFAQDDEEKEEKEKTPYFTKEKLFTGGSVGFGFGQGTFQLGLGPFIGYSFNKYIDVGLALNYNYVSQRDQFSTYKVRQTIIGPGAFTRIYPVKFLFVTAQYEYNFIKFREITGAGFPDVVTKYNVESMLVGGGYTQGRENDGSPFFFVSILFDVAKNQFSPYKDNFNRAQPIFRTGLHYPLFQGNSGGNKNRRSRRRDDF